MTQSVRPVAAVLLSLLVPTCLLAAEQPCGVKLLRPDTLAGWDHGTKPIEGWTIADGLLSGTVTSTPLLSGWTFGDFELRFDWSVSGGGAWKISLPEAQTGRGLELTLCEGNGCGRLQDGKKTLAPGGTVEPSKAKMHSAVISRTGAKLSLAVDDRRLYEVDLQADRRFGLALAVAGGQAALTDIRFQEPSGKTIFNGKNLCGWWTPGDINAWQVENDQLTLSQRGGNYIRTKKLYENFTLSVEYQIAPGGNSGVGIHTLPDGWPSGDGLELQIWDKPADTPLDKHQTMAIYGNVPPLARADKPDEWNSVVIKADGPMVSAWVNGELVQQYNTFHHPELKHRPTAGWIGFQDHKDGVRFRNVRVLEAPDGSGLAAWQRPEPPCAATAVLDRLLNTEQLAVADGIRSGVVTTTVDDDNQSQQVLAELEGPGAVVRIAFTSDKGRLAFYFDGEKTPRIECEPEELRDILPHLTDYRNPVSTFLGYRKSLSVVLRDAKPCEYRFDYLVLPERLPVQTFVDATSGFPRGWLSAALYRTLRCRTGHFRMSDTMPRLESEQETICPGETLKLAHLDGAGIARWVKLKVEKKLLANDDLWLEVTVDGEESPAVSAPARYWFPGLAGQNNFFNFVMFSREGTANILAMPYSDGITVSVSNHGTKPIADVGIQIYYEPVSSKKKDEIAGRMRLRGVFQSGEEGADELIRQEGSGRWVGLVYQQPDDSLTAIDSLLVDGQPAEGWAASSLNSFLGSPSDDFRTALSGRHDNLCWRYLLLAPIDFGKSLVLKTGSDRIGDRLALFYMKK